jgi:hypothetical protein
MCDGKCCECCIYYEDLGRELLVPLIDVVVDVLLKGNLGKTEISFTYKNHTNDTIKPILRYPIKDGKILNEFKIRVNDQTINSKIVKKE